MIDALLLSLMEIVRSLTPQYFNFDRSRTFQRKSYFIQVQRSYRLFTRRLRHPGNRSCLKSFYPCEVWVNVSLVVSLRRARRGKEFWLTGDQCLICGGMERGRLCSQVSLYDTTAWKGYPKIPNRSWGPFLDTPGNYRARKGVLFSIPDGSFNSFEYYTVKLLA